MASLDDGEEYVVTVLLTDEGRVFGRHSFCVPRRGNSSDCFTLRNNEGVEFTLHVGLAVDVPMTPQPNEERSPQEIRPEGTQDRQSKTAERE